MFELRFSKYASHFEGRPYASLGIRPLLKYNFNEPVFLSYSVKKKATLSALVVILSASTGSSSLNLTPEGNIISTYPPSLVIAGSKVNGIECPKTNLTEGYCSK